MELPGGIEVGIDELALVFQQRPHAFEDDGMIVREEHPWPSPAGFLHASALHVSASCAAGGIGM